MVATCAILKRRKNSLPVPPKVQLHLGSTLNAENIKEGDDVYFECKVRANPEHHKITWRHNVSHNHRSRDPWPSASNPRKVSRFSAAKFLELSGNARSQSEKTIAGLSFPSERSSLYLCMRFFGRKKRSTSARTEYRRCIPNLYREVSAKEISTRKR